MEEMDRSEYQKLKMTMLELLIFRGRDATICPSEVPRKCFPDDWRRYMDLTRLIAQELAEEGKVHLMQRGKTIDPNKLKGPIRIRLI